MSSKVLNAVLSAELTGINQYFIHAMMCANWRYKRLAEHTRKESIEEMKHAQEVIERILYLDGVPNMQRYLKVNVGQSVPEQHEFDLALEKEAVARLNKGVELCRDEGRQRLARAAREASRRRGGARGLAGGAAPADPGHGHPELPRPAG